MSGFTTGRVRLSDPAPTMADIVQGIKNDINLRANVIMRLLETCYLRDRQRRKWRGKVMYFKYGATRLVP